MLSIKKIALFALCVFTFVNTLQAQKVTITPAPDEIDLNAPATIVIDVNACDTNPLQGFAGEVYLWTWVDGASPTNDNGGWASSSAGQLMTPVVGQPGKYSFTFAPSVLAYYGLTAAQVFGSAKGLGMLAKMKDGTGDMKTEDIFIKIPQPVVGKVLVGSYPAKLGDTLYVNNDDIVHFVYNNSLDTLAHMNDVANPLGPDDITVFTRAYFDDGSFLNYHKAGGDPYYMLPSLSLKYIGNKEYNLPFIPDMFFTEAGGCPNFQAIADKITLGKKLTKITMRVYRKPLPGTTTAKPGPGVYEMILPKQ
jgi:hypothetical protein